MWLARAQTSEVLKNMGCSGQLDDFTTNFRTLMNPTLLIQQEFPIRNIITFTVQNNMLSVLLDSGLNHVGFQTHHRVSHTSNSELRRHTHSDPQDLFQFSIWLPISKRFMCTYKKKASQYQTPCNKPGAVMMMIYTCLGPFRLINLGGSHYIWYYYILWMIAKPCTS